MVIGNEQDPGGMCYSLPGIVCASTGVLGMLPQGGARRTRDTRPPALLAWERSRRPQPPLATAVGGDQVTRTSTRQHVATTPPGCVSTMPGRAVRIARHLRRSRPRPRAAHAFASGVKDSL